MNLKFILYVINTLVVFVALDSININSIFKKNKNIQAKIFYFILGFSLVYLLTNFMYDFIECSKII